MSARDKLLLTAFLDKAEEKTGGKREAVLLGKCASMESYKAETAYLKAWAEAIEILSALINKDFDTDLGDWTNASD